MSDSWSDDSAQRAFETVWETLHVGETVPAVRAGASGVDVVRTIVPSEDAGRRLDFSLVTLPHLTGGTGETASAPQLELGPTIGRGGMAMVHRARQVALQRDVAVKMLRPELRSPESTRVLLSEAWVTGLLEHPNIVPVYELGQDATGSPLLVMKAIGGTAWRDFLKNPDAHAAAFGKQTPLEWHLGIFVQVCNAVHYAHSKGIIHRDLKPDNVMIGEFGEVYVLDWGLAVSTEDSGGRFRSAKSVDAIAGTPGYLAPEMIEYTRREISTRTDIYLLGAVLHELLTGSPRHTGKTLFDVMFSAFRSDAYAYGEDVPAELAAIANRAAHAVPSARYASAEELKQAILEFLRHRESAALEHEAVMRLRAMEAELAKARTLKGAVEPGDVLRVHRIFAEARFGFEQALRVWSDNPRARSGLEAALTAMADHELSRGAYESAALLIAELPQPAPELRARLEELGRAQIEAKARVEKLERLAHDVDLAASAKARARFAAILAVAWTILPFSVAFLTKSGIIIVDYPGYLLQTAFFGGLLLVCLYFGRRALLQNEINRRIMSAALFIFLSALVHRLISYVLAIPLHAALVQELENHMLALGLLAITVDRRIGYAAIAYLIASWGAALYPNYIYEWHGIGNSTALTSVALAWRPKKAR